MKKFVCALALLWVLVPNNSFAQYPSFAHLNKEVKCLTDNMYYEAGNLGLKGMRAVGHVTVNRVSHEYFPNTVCKVVYHVYQGRVQFNWTTKKFLPYRDPHLYARASIMAQNILAKLDPDPTNGALFFAAAEDGWFHYAKSKNLIILTYQTGPQRFYRLNDRRKSN